MSVKDTEIKRLNQSINQSRLGIYNFIDNSTMFNWSAAYLHLNLISVFCVFDK